MIGAALGYPVTVCLPSNASAERKRILRIYGCEVIDTDPLSGTDGAQREARRLVARDPDRYFYADQYNNAANWQAHFEHTGGGDSGPRPGGASRTSSPGSARRARSSARRAASRCTTGLSAASRCNPTCRCTGSRA